MSVQGKHVVDNSICVFDPWQITHAAMKLNGLGRGGITVNAICPGFIETPLLGRSTQNIVKKTGMSTQDAVQPVNLAGQ